MRDQTISLRGPVIVRHLNRIAIFAISLWSMVGATPTPAQAPSELARTTEADHQQMMQQLGITELRKGPNGDATAPDRPQLIITYSLP